MLASHPLAFAGECFGAAVNRGIFLDRDGVLNELVYYPDSLEYEAPRTPEDFRLIPGVVDALHGFHTEQYLLFLVSNQPSLAKGKTSLEALTSVHARLEASLAEVGLAFQGVYYCYHHPMGVVPAYTCVCDCRKPGIRSLLRARDAFRLDFSQCWMIGDQDTDVLCGQRAGCRTIQIEYEPSQPKRGHSQPDHLCRSLSEAMKILIEFR